MSETTMCEGCGHDPDHHYITGCAVAGCACEWWRPRPVPHESSTAEDATYMYVHGEPGAEGMSFKVEDGALRVVADDPWYAVTLEYDESVKLAAMLARVIADWPDEEGA